MKEYTRCEPRRIRFGEVFCNALKGFGFFRAEVAGFVAQVTACATFPDAEGLFAFLTVFAPAMPVTQRRKKVWVPVFASSTRNRDDDP